MNEQTTYPSPSTETTDRVPTRPRERGLGGIDTRPVFHRLNGGVGTDWNDVLGKINGLKGMRWPETRTAYLRYVGENVATSADVLPGAPFYVDELGRLARREQAKTAGEKFANPVVLSKEVVDFLDRRSIGVRGETLFWFDPIPSKKKVYGGVNPRTGVANYYDQRQTAFRQGHVLTQDEAKTFKALDESVRDAIISMAPAYSPAPAN